MKLEDQVCSLEYAKKLKELGIEKESLFIYFEQSWIIQGNEVLETRSFIRINDFTTFIDDSMKTFSAYTAGELLRLIPNGLALNHGEPFNSFRFNLAKSVKVEQTSPITLKAIYLPNYFCDTMNPESPNPWFTQTLIPNCWDENCANALAKALIYLLENNLITKEHINAL